MKSSLLFLLAVLLSSVIHAEEADSVKVVIDKGLDEYWLVEKKVAPVYPSRALQRGLSGCVTVGYVIEPDGSTGQHKVLVSLPSKIFERSAIVAAKKFRYLPAESNLQQQPIFTINTFTYQLSDSRSETRDRDELVALCSSKAKELLADIASAEN